MDQPNRWCDESRRHHWLYESQYNVGRSSKWPVTKQRDASYGSEYRVPESYLESKAWERTDHWEHPILSSGDSNNPWEDSAKAHFQPWSCCYAPKSRFNLSNWHSSLMMCQRFAFSFVRLWWWCFFRHSSFSVLTILLEYLQVMCSQSGNESERRSLDTFISNLTSNFIRTSISTFHMTLWWAWEADSIRVSMILSIYIESNISGTLCRYGISSKVIEIFLKSSLTSVREVCTDISLRLFTEHVLSRTKHNIWLCCYITMWRRLR